MALTGPQNGQLGIGRESTWGTPVAPSTFLPLLSEDIDLSFDPLIDEAVRAGRRMQIAEQHQNGNRQVGGSFQTHLYGIGLRKLLQSLMGTETDPGSGSPTRAFVYTPGDLSDDPLTVQVNAPSSAGNQVKTIEGAMLTGATWEYRAGQLVTVTWDLVGEDLVRTTSPAAASYPAAVAHKAVGMVFGLTGSAGTMKSLRMRFDNGLDVGRYRADSDKRKKPLEAGVRKVELDVVLEYVDNAAITAHEAHTEVEANFYTTDGTNTLLWAVHGYVKPGAGQKLNTRTGLLEHTVGIMAFADAAGGTDADAVTATYTTSEGVP
ncbi:MAG: phage tail tube protein [Acidimicrobiales bacterium]